MSLLKKTKSEVIKKYAASAKDTGSTEVQVAILTQRIQQLTEHMKIHKKDMGSRKGLLTMVSNRRSLLNYLKKDNTKRYEVLIDSLGLRR
jgi:small subunit ribosomal protein S15